MDLATSADRHNVAIARMSYTSVTGDPKLNLQLIERTPIGGWSTRTVESDIGVNSGDAGLAYGPTGQPSIAYVRSNTQSLELTTRASDGTWQNTAVTSGPEFSLFKLVDLAFDREGRSARNVQRFGRVATCVPRTQPVGKLNRCRPPHGLATAPASIEMAACTCPSDIRIRTAMLPSFMFATKPAGPL